MATGESYEKSRYRNGQVRGRLFKERQVQPRCLLFVGPYGRPRSSKTQLLTLIVLPTIGYLLIMFAQMENLYGFIASPSSSSTEILLSLSRGGADGSLKSFKGRGLATPTMTDYWISLQQGHTRNNLSSQFSLHLLDPLTSRRRFRPNYGYLEFSRLNASWFERTIDEREDTKWYHMSRYQQLRRIDQEVDRRDFSKTDPTRYTHYEDIDFPKPSGCYRPRWTYAVYPTCNVFHEQTMDRPVESTRLNVTYLGRGYFRATWLLEDIEASGQDHPEEFVLKLLRLSDRRSFTHHTFFAIQLEALVMERTTSSTRTSNAYGYCGSSIAVERGFPISRSILPSYSFYHSKDAPKQPANPDISLEQKLKVAVQMAEGLAYLHGDPKGVIVNDDIQVQQWLLDRNGNVKLNDMNNGKVLQWNPEKQEYCTFSASFDYLWRPPEETNRYAPTDETTDVYSLGQIYYTLLTGLMPFYERGDWETAIAANRKGRLPYVADQYRDSNATTIERRLVTLMERIWQYKKEDRPSIFEVLRHLRDTVQMYETENPAKAKIADVALLNLVRT
jgi:hypothetical protein